MRPGDGRFGCARVGALATVLVGLMVWPAAANSFDEAMKVREEGNKASAESQTRVDALDDTTEQLITQYRSVMGQLDAIRIYNGQLRQLIADQNEEIASLNRQIDEVELVGRQVQPHMLKMIDAIERFVELDVPFLLEERTDRVSRLRELMARADVTDAEKYRAIMEAYQIENEFGRTIEAYEGQLEIDGQNREVNFLRVGRIGLLYQSFDGAESGAWDQRGRQWTPLAREYASSIKQGLRMARKQAAPDLIQIPVPAAEAAQ